MAKGYQIIAFLYEEDSPEHREFLDKRDEIQWNVCRMYPEDVDALVTCLKFVTSDEEELKVREKILSKDPNRGSTRIGFGRLLMKMGDWRGGFDQIAKGVQSIDNLVDLDLFTRRFID